MSTFLNGRNEKLSSSLLWIISSTNYGLYRDVFKKKRKNRKSTNLNHPKPKRRYICKNRDLGVWGLYGHFGWLK